MDYILAGCHLAEAEAVLLRSWRHDALHHLCQCHMATTIRRPVRFEGRKFQGKRNWTKTLRSRLCFCCLAIVSVRSTSHSDVAQGEKKRGATSSDVTSPHPLHLSVSSSGSASTATSCKCNQRNHGMSSATSVDWYDVQL